MHHVDLDRPVILACNLELGVLAILIREACRHTTTPQPSVESHAARSFAYVIMRQVFPVSKRIKS